MSDPENNTVADQEMEELTAYLDGELDAEAARVVEHRLGSDESYRQKLHRLESAWRLLDHLPAAEADEKFTQTTVEMLAVAAEEEVASAASAAKGRRWIRGLLAASLLIAAGLLGYVLIGNAANRENENLVRDLPVIENVELYRHIDSVDFLMQLEHEGLFAEDTEDVEEVGDES